MDRIGRIDKIWMARIATIDSGVFRGDTAIVE